MSEAKATQAGRYKVGEVCRIADVPPYVLRYWETEFPVLAPERPGASPRLYSERDLSVIKTIRRLLYDEGYTIAGAKKRLEADLKREGLSGAGESTAAAVEKPRPVVDTAELPFEDLAPPPPPPPAPKTDTKTKRIPRPTKPASSLPGGDEVGAKLAAIESLPSDRPVDRSPVEVVKVTDPRLQSALSELKEILESLSRPLD
ncbi:MAG: hypothetical protein DIJKHBIC_00540 [Thermoanaerobaculia bacterium]|nr:hypothetical protein [Thermoanaerobaculia bacterium]